MRAKPMRRRLLSLALLSALLAAPAIWSQEMKVAILDIDRAMRESPAGVALAAEIAKVEESATSEAERLQQEDQTLRQSAAGKSGQELVDIQRRLEDLPRELRRLRDRATREAETLRNSRMQELNEQMAPVLNQIIDERGLTLVLNSSLGGILHADKTLDITDELIQRMNG